MICPVKVFDKQGKLKRIISKEELEEGFWKLPNSKSKSKSKGNSNSYFFALKDKHSDAEVDYKLTHGTFHPTIS